MEFRGRDCQEGYGERFNDGRGFESGCGLERAMHTVNQGFTTRSMSEKNSIS